MNKDLPSRTAMRVAMRRAAHQLLDQPRVLDDPLAVRIIGGQATAHRGEDGRLARALRAFMAVRSRLAEDELARAVEGGVGQYVVLGAGLDTFACRYQGDGLRIFEVDHPATQAWKREQLRAAGLQIPGCLTFVPVDFEKQTAGEELHKSGLDPQKPVFFSWLGVTMYLSLEAVMNTFRFVASMPAGSGLVFDYGLPPASLSLGQRMVFEMMALRVKALGEPWQTFFDPVVLMNDLVAAGFREVQDWGADELNEQYFKDRADGLKVGGLAHVMVARV